MQTVRAHAGRRAGCRHRTHRQQHENAALPHEPPNDDDTQRSEYCKDPEDTPAPVSARAGEPVAQGQEADADDEVREPVDGDGD